MPHAPPSSESPIGGSAVALPPASESSSGVSRIFMTISSKDCTMPARNFALVSIYTIAWRRHGWGRGMEGGGPEGATAWQSARGEGKHWASIGRSRLLPRECLRLRVRHLPRLQVDLVPYLKPAAAGEIRLGARSVTTTACAGAREGRRAPSGQARRGDGRRRRARRTSSPAAWPRVQSWRIAQTLRAIGASAQTTNGR